MLRVVGRLPWTGGGGAWPWPAGVGQASGEETAGGLRRGGARAPLSRADLVAKAKKNMAYGGWDEARAERLIAFSETFGDGTGPLTLAEFAA